MKLAREKANREQEAHGWLAALQPDKLREQAGKAKTAEEKAKTAEAEAENAPELYKEKVNTEKNRGEAQRASATNSYASARAHNRSNNEFSAWDENGREHKFRTKEAAEYFARQHGTMSQDDVVTSSTSNDIVDNGEIMTDSVGKPLQQHHYNRKPYPVKPKKKVNPMGNNGKRENPMS